MVPVPNSYIDPSLLDNMKKVDKINYAGNCLNGSTPRLAPTRRHIKRCVIERRTRTVVPSNLRNMMYEIPGVVEDTQQI